MKKTHKNLEPSPLNLHLVPTIKTLSTNPSRPQTEGLSHPLRYSKAFFSQIQQNPSNFKPPLNETDYKSFFNKTATSPFYPQKNQNQIFNNTRTSFNQTKASFHSNLFITTKIPQFSPKESLCTFERPFISKFEIQKPLTSMSTHRYQRSTFLDDKIMTENFFLHFDSTLHKTKTAELEKNQRVIHSSSLSYINKAVKTPSLIKIQAPQSEMRPEDFQAYRRKVITIRDREEAIVKKPIIEGRRFKIKTMLHAPQMEELKLSVKETIEKRLLRVPKEKYPMQNYKTKKTMLIIEDTLLDQINHKTNLKYCYLDIPSFQDHTFEKLRECSQALIKEISNKFNLNARDLYLYLKSGTPVKDFIEIPENEYTLIVSPRTAFQGLTNKKSPVFYKFFKTLTIISELERPLKIYNESKGRGEISKDRTYEFKIKEKYKDLISNTVKLIQGEPVDEDIEKPMRFNTTQEYFDEKNLQETLYETKKLKELDKIEKMYERNLKKIKFENQEVTDSSDEDYQKIIRRTSQSTSMLAMDTFQEKTAKVAKKLDEIINKWLKKASKTNKTNDKNEKNAKNEKTIENDDKTDNKKGNADDSEEEKKSQESEEVDDNLFGENEEKKKDYVEINKNQFRNNKRVLELLHKENKELFLQNIPKLMNKTNFTRSEIHTCYILFKVLQHISSQRIPNYSMKKFFFLLIRDFFL